MNERKRKPNSNKRECVWTIGERKKIKNRAEIEEVHKDRIITKSNQEK